MYNDDEPTFDGPDDDEDTGEIWFQRGNPTVPRSWHKTKNLVQKPLQEELVAWCGRRWPVESVNVFQQLNCPGKICQACIIEENKIAEKEKADAALERERIFTRSESTRFNE